MNTLPTHVADLIKEQALRLTKDDIHSYIKSDVMHIVDRWVETPTTKDENFFDFIHEHDPDATFDIQQCQYDDAYRALTVHFSNGTFFTYFGISFDKWRYDAEFYLIEYTFDPSTKMISILRLYQANDNQDYSCINLAEYHAHHQRYMYILPFYIGLGRTDNDLSFDQRISNTSRRWWRPRDIMRGLDPILGLNYWLHQF